MDRKTYMKNIYSKYWISARENEYKFSNYDKNLCNYIINNINKNEAILEVGIGTGYPFADFFQKNGYNIYGIDIAPLLIEKCKKLNKNINCKVGDAENIDYPDNFFKCTYSFHSTFYFPDLSRVIDEMIRVTSPGGLIVFDIQNRDNEKIIKNYNKMVSSKRNIFKKLVRYFKNIIKIILGNKATDWTNVVHEIPTFPDTIYKHLKKININNYKVLARPKDEKNNDFFKLKIENDHIAEHPRLVFSIKKSETK